MTRPEVRSLARELYPAAHVTDFHNVTFSADRSVAFVEAVLEVRMLEEVEAPAPGNGGVGA